MSFVTREATVTDAAAIIEFQQAMARETESIELDAPTVTRGVHAVFEDLSRGRYFVAEASGEVIASLLITYEWSDWRNGNVWWIQSVYVDSAFRRRGIYPRMYEDVRAAAGRDATVRGIRRYVHRRNTPAHQVDRACRRRADHKLV